MHFVHRLRTIWSWLPAFRAVAETQHLPTAARQLGVVPSSVSRMVKQLEDELGVVFFDRTAKSMVLNDAGRRFLLAVREAMRLIDDALGSAIGDDVTGELGAVATGDLAHLVMIPAAAAVQRSHPALVVTTSVARIEDIVAMLLRGDADAGLVSERPPLDPDLRAIDLGPWSRAIYARSAELPARGARCVVVGTASEPSDDGWPEDVAREIASWAPDQRAALESCVRGESMVTVAHDAAVRSYGYTDRLVRLAAPAIAPTTLHLLHRRAIGRHRRTEVLVDAIRTAALDVGR